MKKLLLIYLVAAFAACQPAKNAPTESDLNITSLIKPTIITQRVAHDTDDPAIWINKKDAAKSLIIGTDKGDDNGIGALYVFNLEGKIVDTVSNIKRPNNVDIAYDFEFSGQHIDIAVCTERNTNSIRVFKLPEMEPVDNGGIPVFEQDSLRAPMGIALYTRQPDGKIYAIVSRKFGPANGYLGQYELYEENGSVEGNLVRSFGKFSGIKEIEAIAVDNELGYVYYSDENVGVRKYYAHPDSGNVELALFGKERFTRDHEGISIYKTSDSTGYILVSDQQANTFQVYSREGTGDNPHQHTFMKTVFLSTSESDGSDVTNVPLNSGFQRGLFAAMSDDGTFHFYKWQDIAGEELK
ncbi:phytase [Fulvivirga sp. M361]|uniref:phytase n=1 Tax=Fulvivirga sp. M361 TaxID=2594266 RepID=UPI00117A8BE9|nr:phytase [Fulvivirga sp. M361]TRX58694.1 phytase [Fulvivirga sp. M361]